MLFKNTLGKLLILLGAASAPTIPMTAVAQTPEATASASAFQPFPGSVAPETLAASMVGETVTVTGRIVETRASTASNIPTQLRLTAPGHEPGFVVVYWEAAAPHVEQGRGAPQPGTQISVTGPVEDYRGTLQVRVRHSNQIRIEGYGASASPAAATTAAPRGEESAPAAPAANVPVPGADGYFTMDQLPAMKAALQGQWVSLKATVREFRDPTSERAPSVIVLQGAGQTLDAIYWAPRDAEEAPRFDHPGKQAYVSGILGQYRERWQLQIQEVENISLEPLAEARLARSRTQPRVATTPASEGWPGGQPVGAIERVTLEPGTEVALNQLGPSHVGNTLTINGRSGRVFERDGAVHITLHMGVSTLFVQVPPTFNQLIPEGTQLTTVGEIKWDDVRLKPFMVVESPENIRRRE